MTFKLKSQGSSFKMMGSSPVKQKVDLKPYKFGDDADQDDIDLTRKGPPYESRMSKEEKEKKRQEREKANRFEHNVEAKMDEYPPKYFHGDIKKKSPVEQTEGMLLKKKGTIKRSTPPVKGEKLWYKINGKNATKAEYMAYENKPGGDEKGKQTNDPNVSLAKQSGDKRK